MIKILLTSDFHLGKKEDLPGFEDIRLKTFKRVSLIANSFDLLLIAGDLFDNIDVDSRIIETVVDEFNKVLDNGVKIIFTPGETELDNVGRLHKSFSELNVTRIFDSLSGYKPYKMLKDGQKIIIYGLPGAGMADISSLKRIDDDGFHIGLFHADYRLDAAGAGHNVSILNREDIKNTNFDFYALGHQHQFKLFKSFGRIIGAYPGTPEATAFSEQGERYALSMTISNNEINQIKRLTINSVKLLETEIECSELSDMDALLDELENNVSPQTILKLILKGNRDFLLDKRALREYEKKYFKLLLENQSIPTLETLITENIKDDTLSGEFFLILKRRLGNGLSLDIDQTVLANILIDLMYSKNFSIEESFCRYKDV